MQFTPVRDIAARVTACRGYFNSGKTLPIGARLESLHKLVRALDEFQEPLLGALYADLRKSRTEAQLAEIDMARSEAWLAISHLREWAAPEHVEKEGIQKLDTAYTLYDPLGVVLIIGAWNYPVQLTLVGLVGALAAGNTAILKPSEVSTNTARVVTELVEKTFPADLVSVVNGGVAETTELLTQRFDHILYTGNGKVARIIAAAAAKNLTPVTLELGGKSPTYVDAGVDVATAARRIMWGRVFNAGQTCVAPDYVLAHQSVKAALLVEMKKAVEAFFGPDPKASPDYGRIVNDAHFKRIMALIPGGRVVFGGESDAAQRYIAPTVLDDVNLESPLMTEEIFGPLIPVVAVSGPDEAIAFINARDKPLALYVFTPNSTVKEAFLRRTSAGGVTVNDTIMHTSFETLPFGGVGCSGCGAYHGKRTFTMFSHQKAVLEKNAGMEFANDLRYPPYTEGKLSLLRRLLVRTGPTTNFVQYAIVGALLAAAVAVYFQYTRRA
jgi:acyl-CoA reductase-like NAD-dependent aldehyde dehydrogenase